MKCRIPVSLKPVLGNAGHEAGDFPGFPWQERPQKPGEYWAIELVVGLQPTILETTMPPTGCNKLL